MSDKKKVRITLNKDGVYVVTVDKRSVWTLPEDSEMRYIEALLVQVLGLNLGHEVIMDAGVI